MSHASHNEDDSMSRSTIFASEVTVENGSLTSDDDSSSSSEDIDAIEEVREEEVREEEVKEEETREACAICREPILNQQSAHCLPCAHRFHLGCAARWLDINPVCPVCRHPSNSTTNNLPGIGSHDLSFFNIIGGPSLPNNNNLESDNVRDYNMLSQQSEYIRSLFPLVSLYAQNQEPQLPQLPRDPSINNNPQDYESILSNIVGMRENYPNERQYRDNFYERYNDYLERRYQNNPRIHHTQNSNDELVRNMLRSTVSTALSLWFPSTRSIVPGTTDQASTVIANGIIGIISSMGSHPPRQHYR